MTVSIPPAFSRPLQRCLFVVVAVVGLWGVVAGSVRGQVENDVRSTASAKTAHETAKYWILLTDRPPPSSPHVSLLKGENKRGVCRNAALPQDQHPSPSLGGRHPSCPSLGGKGLQKNATPEALRRRAVRGTKQAQSLTRPVAYREELRALGVEPVTASRWLHAVSAVLRPEQVEAVRAQPFVDAVRPVRSHPTPAAEPPSEATSQRIAAPSAPFTALAPPDRAGSRAFLAAPPADSSFYGSSYTQLRLMNALAPMDRGIIGRGVRIGFLDTGYRGLQHPAFDRLRSSGRILGIRDFTQKPQSNNHGSGVVSATAGYDPGILVGPAHGAEVVAASTEYTPSETNVEEDYFVAGLEWLEAQGVDVVNVSLGYTTFDEGERSYTVGDLDGDTGVTTRAVDAAAQLGVTVVVSAGNSGCDDPENCWYYVSTPADADSAITVGAVTPDSSVASFSSRGPTADDRIKPDVAALGRGVTSAWNDADYARVNGTSFSSPLVTGVVGQMLQQNPRLRPMEVRALLRRTASQSATPDNRLGWGIVNADAAVRAAERLARESPPTAMSISPPYPSPASDRVTFDVRAPRTVEAVQVELYDVLGRRVRRADRALQPGPNSVRVAVDDLPPGVYLYRLRTAATVVTGKVVVVR